MDRRKALAGAGVMRFAAEFTRLGESTFIPIDESGPIDLVVLRGKLLRVQVKSVKPIRGVLIVPFRSSNNWSVKKYTSADIDLFGVYDHVNDKGYLLNFS
jgi:hypothetical protein